MGGKTGSKNLLRAYCDDEYYCIWVNISPNSFLMLLIPGDRHQPLIGGPHDRILACYLGCYSVVEYKMQPSASASVAILRIQFAGFCRFARYDRPSFMATALDASQRRPRCSRPMLNVSQGSPCPPRSGFHRRT